MVLALGAVCGCQSNSEMDYIARDRRMREDQIYALQDYIQQYQRLVCQYRSENASLRRQISEGYVVEPQRTQADPYTPPKNGATPNQGKPSLPTTQPTTPPIDDIEVPPLKTTSFGEPSATQLAFGGERSNSDRPMPQVTTASYEEPVKPAGEPSDRLPPVANSNACDVMVCGQVIANETGGGPRLMVDVVPFNKAGQVESFAGRLLLVVTNMTDGRQRKICGWEFGADEVQAAVDPNADEPTMRFYVELPAAADVDQPAVLWARLIPSAGPKLFAHAKVNLATTGVFATHTNKNWAAEGSQVADEEQELVAPATFEEPLTPPDERAEVTESTRRLLSSEFSASDARGAYGEVASAMSGGGWSVAEPGKPANLPAGSQDQSGAGGWRASSEPMPAAIAVSNEPLAAPKERPQNVQLSTKTEEPTVAGGDKGTAARPGWAPERAGESRRSVAERASWSATR